MPQDDDAMDWVVLMNDEQQYSLWPAATAVPAGWRTVMQAGSKDAALAYVNAIWADMRPLSLRHS